MSVGVAVGIGGRRNLASILANMGGTDPYASLRDATHQWKFQEALATDNANDSIGVYHETKANDPPVIVGGGRVTMADGGTMRHFASAVNLDLNINCTIACWYYRFADTGIVDYIFSNRGVSGQFVLIFITDHWEVYILDNVGAQQGPYSPVGDAVPATWKLIVFRYNATTKAISLSINNGAASNSATHAHVLGPAMPLGFGGDAPITAVQGHIGRRTTIMWNRIITAPEEALLYAAGSTFTL